jgi:hypothetical protein
MSERTRIVSVGHVSNAIGTIHPIREIVDMAHAVGAIVVVDGAQGAPHLRVDVQALGCDFYAVSGHKMCGPMGIGILWGRRELLDAMPPYQGGGEMIDVVTTEGSTYKRAPHRFEAGTPNVGGAIALAAAADFLDGLGHDALWAHEQELTRYGLERLGAVEGVHVFGPHDPRSGRPSSPSAWTACTPTTSRRSSMPKASRSGPATTAASHSCDDWASRRRPVRRATSTTRRTKSTASRRPSSGRATSSADSAASRPGTAPSPLLEQSSELRRHRGRAPHLRPCSNSPRSFAGGSAAGHRTFAPARTVLGASPAVARPDTAPSPLLEQSSELRSCGTRRLRRCDARPLVAMRAVAAGAKVRCPAAGAMRAVAAGAKVRCPAAGAMQAVAAGAKVRCPAARCDAGGGGRGGTVPPSPIA